MTKFDENLIEMRRISTHIPLVRYDDRVREMKLTQTISTHIPLARYDENGAERPKRPKKFQSTYRSRGMSDQSAAVDELREFQSTYRSRGMSQIRN